MKPLCCLLATALVSTALAGDKPNVLFIAVDDLRPEFGAYGADYVKSPNLDRLAKSGITFGRAYCQQAVCSPTRSSLMTGTRPDTTKVWDLNTHFRKALPNVVTLAQHFKNNGYFVQGMGKIYHGGYDDPVTWSVPWQRPNAPTYALKENLTGEAPALTAEPDAAPKKGGKKGAEKRKDATPPGSRGPAFEGAEVPDDTFVDGKIADLAVTTLRDISKKKEPFFLAVGFARPHLPFVSPKKYWDLYDPATLALAPNKFRPKDAPDYAIVPGGELRAYRGIPGGSIPDDLARQLKHGYYAAISYMDAQLGKVLDELDRLGLAKNTIVVLWGDHGWKLGEHDAWVQTHQLRERHPRRAAALRARPETRRRAHRFPRRVCGHLPHASRPRRPPAARAPRGPELQAAARKFRAPMEAGRVQPIPARQRWPAAHGLRNAHRAPPLRRLGRTRRPHENRRH